MDIALLERIPQELMDGILAFIPSCSDRSRLSQASSITRARTLKGLFTNISLTWCAKDHLPEWPSGSSPRIDLLLCAILEKPQYASEIRTLELLAPGYGYPNKPPVPIMTNTPKADLARLAQLALQQHGHSKGEEWLEALDQCDLGAIIALLLLQCQNLSSLTLGSTLLRSNAYLPRLLAQSFLRPNPVRLFQRLRYFQIDGYGTDARFRITKYIHRMARELDWRTYLSLFNCPSLREMDISLQENLTRKGLSQLTTSISNHALQSLRLHGSSIKPITLAKVLQWTPNLVRLEYQYCFRHPRPMIMENLRTALLPLRHTLKEFLFMPTKVRCRCAFSNDIHVIGHCSLADFTALESICTPPWALFGWQPDRTPPLQTILPKSLQSLDLLDTFIGWQSYQWIDKELHDYFANSWDDNRSDFSTHSLKNIMFVNDNATVWFSRDVKTALEDLCQRHGLTCDTRCCKNS